MDSRPSPSRGQALRGNDCVRGVQMTPPVPTTCVGRRPHQKHGTMEYDGLDRMQMAIAFLKRYPWAGGAAALDLGASTGLERSEPQTNKAGMSFRTIRTARLTKRTRIVTNVL